jgi:Ser/Thr protein kinase RdoA (MazF antagonist)
MSVDRDPTPLVMRFYPDWCWPESVEFLGGAGGFSGARFWRMGSAGGELCLRRWPVEHPSPERLAFIHSILGRAWRNGFRRLPRPIATNQGQTFFRHEGRLWELTPWLPGAADYPSAPSAARLRGAMRALAEFHLAVAGDESAPSAAAGSPGLLERASQARRLASGGMEDLAAAVRSKSISGLQEQATRVLSLARGAMDDVARDLRRATEINVPLQPAIRDIWRDHVLFVGEEVSGIIDFGAMRIESVCGDVARLLGSLAGNNVAQWNIGIEAYRALRPLSAEEEALMPVFERSGIVLAGVNWLEWLYCEGRQFENLPAVRQRLEEIGDRLEAGNSLAT